MRGHRRSRDRTRRRRQRSTAWTAWLLRLLGVVVVLAGAVAVWGVAIEPRLILDEREETAAVPRLPGAWEGARIAVIADLQIGMWLENDGMVRRIVGRIVAERPAAVLIAGDFIYHPTDDEPEEVREEYEHEEALDELREVVELLRPLTDARIPTYAVLGNHDYGMETREAVKLDWLAGRVTATLEDLGIRVLQNEAVPMTSANGNSLYLVGIGPLIPEEARPDTALAQVPADAPRIVLMHNPDVFGRLPAGAAPLAVAGHTHGGQIRIPFLPRWSWMSLVETDEVHTDGWIHDYGAPGNRLYVNRGIGFSKLPIRLNCPPELTIFTLRPAADTGR